MSGPESSPERPKLLFDYYGVTGVGRHRIIDGDGAVVQPPRTWRQILFGGIEKQP